MHDYIPTTTVIACPKCATPVRVPQGQDEGRCEACATIVHRATTPTAAAGGAGAGDRGTSVMLAGIVVLCAAGVGVWMLGRPVAAPPPPRPAPISTGRPPPPPLTAPPSVPAGELAWVPQAPPTLTAIDGDGIEDVFGFFRVWDGRSAWTTFAGAFGGKDLAPLWRTEPLDPWLVRKAGIVPMAVAAGKRLLVADATENVRVYTLAGEKQATYKLAQPPRDLCALPDGRVWIDADAPETLDLDSGKLTPAALPPAVCKRPARPAPPRLGAHEDAGVIEARADWAAACEGSYQNHFARATCLSPKKVPALAGVDVRYAVTDGATQIALGTSAPAASAGSGAAQGTRAVPVAVAYGSGGSVVWQRAIAADTTTVTMDSAPHLAELGNLALYVVYGKAYFDGRLEALDAKTGQTRWDVPVVGSLPRTDAFGSRGDATSLVVSESRVYVARSGGGLDVFDAKTGATIGTIGNIASK